MATTNSHHLTDLQFRFCQEYVRNGFSNATAAYHAAGYKATGAAGSKPRSFCEDASSNTCSASSRIRHDLSPPLRARMLCAVSTSMSSRRLGYAPETR